MGVSLFERLPRGIRLTTAGEIVARHLQKSHLAEERMYEWLNEVKGGLRGTVTVAMIEGMITQFMPPLIREFKDKFPNVDLKLRVAGTDEAANLVRNDEADFGIVYQPRDLSELVIDAQFTSKFCAVFNPEHPLSKRKSLLLKDVSHYPTVLNDKTFATRNIIDQACAQSGLRLNVSATINSIEGAKQLARLGVGVVFIPAFAVRTEIAKGELSYSVLSEKIFSNIRFMVVRNRDRELSKSATNFQRILLAAFRKLH